MSIPVCHLKEQYLKYLDVARRLEDTTETGYYKETGCLFPCDGPSYDALAGPSTKIENKTGTPGESMITFMVTYMTGRHELREEYLIYDTTSFIADVGGYLGLLLGHSMYSILRSAVECFKKKL